MDTATTRILTVLASTLAAGLVALSAGQAEAAEILRPMYINPSSDDSAWEAVADACAGGTPVTVVVNAHNGPGFAGDDMPDAAYENAIGPGSRAGARGRGDGERRAAARLSARSRRGSSR